MDGNDVPAEEHPDAKITGFGDNGPDLLAKLQIQDVDEKNRVGADRLWMIWKVLKECCIEIPYPGHEGWRLNHNDWQIL